MVEIHGNTLNVSWMFCRVSTKKCYWWYYYQQSINNALKT